MTKKVARNKPPLDEKWLKQLLERAMDGDETSRGEVRKLLDDAPQIIEPLGGDLAYTAERVLTEAISSKNLAKQEAVRKKMKQLRSQLAGPNPQPIERLLVERVVLCWLHAYHADCQYARAEGTTLQYGEFLQRKQDRAQRRYLAAIKFLATIRRLALPIKLDVNVSGSVTSRPPAPSCRSQLASRSTPASRLGV